MATVSPSPLASSAEKTNGAKLNRLLIDGGTTVLRTIFDGYHPPARLSAGLNAHSFTLNSLLGKRVLRAAQWDKLFPPDGAAPDSQTFDITLLFLLLTNICGLSPPRSGWHSKPSPSDNSLEANLARVKLFRNELYGHVTSTGIDTPTFTSLWQEISAVLVFLGLPQVEIDRLKMENCGEEDYLDLLLEWVKNEEDIKSQLAQLQQSQAEIQQGIVEVRQTQRKLENFKSNLDQLENHQTLDKVHQTQIEVQKGIVEARHTQLKDHRTLEESKSKLDAMFDHRIKTSEDIERVRQMQYTDHKILEEVRETQINTQELRRKDREYESLKKLAKIDVEKDVKYHAERYQEGTRASLFTEVENWLEDMTSKNRVMVISGYPGMGKSVVSAVVCRRLMEVGRLSGCHFCRHNKARQRSPKVMLQSLACQLSESMNEYRDFLVDVLSRNLGLELNDMEVKELFELLFEGPLTKVKNPGKNILMVVDGLDESEYRGRNELLDVISNHFKKLPCWIRFLVTTRPEINIATMLESFSPLTLEPNDEENLRDIRLLLKGKLSNFIQPQDERYVIDELVAKSEGNIMFAYLLSCFIQESTLPCTPEQLVNTLPFGISAVYQNYFKRLEKELFKELNIDEERFLMFLSALVASREPLLLGFVTKILISGKMSQADRRKVRRAIGCISALLPISDECIHFFHKSVKDWLSSSSYYGDHDFIVDVKEGQRILCELCIEEIDDVRRKGIKRGQLSSTNRYALQHGVQHLLEQESARNACWFGEVVEKYVVDVEIVYAKLCTNSAAASEDIVHVQKHKSFSGLCQELIISLDALLCLLRRYTTLLKEFPDAFFHTLLNVGGAKLAREARNLLESKCYELPFMEYVNKAELQGKILAKFSCQSGVICFDVSPQLDFVVCECSGGTIELWSLHTGERQWVRPVTTIEKMNIYRETISSSVRSRETISSSSEKSIGDYSFSCYRSVVFHPAGNFVLPGELRQAYTLGGDLKSLFPRSQCTFTVCSVSGGKTMILTDCLKDNKCIILWSLVNGKEMSRISRDEKVLSFAWSKDENRIAISHLSGSICVLDVMSGFTTIAETTTSKACGMIRFSPDQQSLFAGNVSFEGHVMYHFSLIKGNHQKCLLAVHCHSANGKFCPRNFETRSEPGFLLGDQFAIYSERAITYLNLEWGFVLNKQTVLEGSPHCNVMELLRIPTESTNKENSSSYKIRHLAISLNGESVYVVNESETEKEILAWDTTREELKMKKSVGKLVPTSLLPVKDGVLFSTSDCCLELWNLELSTRIQKWDNIPEMSHLVCMSEERVACIGKANEGVVVFGWGDYELWDIVLNECEQGESYSTAMEQTRSIAKEELSTLEESVVVVVILSVSSGKVLSTIRITNGRLVACSSRLRLITSHDSLVEVLDGGRAVHLPQRLSHKRILDNRIELWGSLRGLAGKFSSSGQYVIICGTAIIRPFPDVIDDDDDDEITPRSSSSLRVFDAVSCMTLHTLSVEGIPTTYSYDFISEEEFVIYTCSYLRSGILQLFNVKSGDPLTAIEIDNFDCHLASCRLKRLIAFDVNDCFAGFRVVRVNLTAKKDDNDTGRYVIYRTVEELTYEAMTH